MCDCTCNDPATALAVLAAHAECGHGREGLRQMLGSSQLLQSCLGLESQLAMRGLCCLECSLAQTQPHVSLAAPASQANTGPSPKRLHSNEHAVVAADVAAGQCSLLLLEIFWQLTPFVGVSVTAGTDRKACKRSCIGCS